MDFKYFTEEADNCISGESTYFACDLGFFLDLDSFVTTCIQVLNNSSYRQYLHQGNSMSLNFLWGKYLFSCQKFGSLFRVCRTFLLIYLLYFYHIIELLR